MSSMFSVFFQVFVALCVVAPVFGYPSRLTNCSRVLAVGNLFMGNAAEAGDPTKIEIRDDANQLRPNGADWFAGMVYTAKLTLAISENFAIDFDSAANTNLNQLCGGKRVYLDDGGNHDITFTVPSDFTGTYTIRLGYTTSRGSPVKAVTTTLVDPNPTAVVPTVSPVGLSGDSCAVCGKNIYEADCGAFSKAINKCEAASSTSTANCCASKSGDCCELNDGLIAGVAVGAFVFIVLCIFGCYYAFNYNSKNGGYDTAQNQEAEIGMQAVNGENGENGEEQVAVTGESAEDKI